MRKIQKTEEPRVLADNHDTWLSAYLADSSSNTHRYRYRHPDIKAALLEETGSKCVYCEGRIGQTSPGDVEHKVPTSVAQDRHFLWSNLTIACTECNRRKSDYHDPSMMFLDPYVDPVEEWLLHIGPLVYWSPANSRAELTVRKLDLDRLQTRPQTFQAKCDILERARSLRDLIALSPNDSLAELRKDELRRMQESKSEYSAMVRSYVGR